MLRVAIDIETAANPARLDAVPPPEPALGNLKDPAKIEAKLAAAREKQLESLALDPHFGRIICWSTALRHDNGIDYDAYIVQALTDDEERALLTALFERLAISEDHQLVTFNGEAFDLPYIMRRAMLLGVPARNLIFPSSYQPRMTDPHVDVYRVLERTDVGNGRWSSNVAPRTLEFYAREFGLEPPPWGDIDKRSLGALIGTPQATHIQAGNVWDVRSTLRLAELLTRYF